MRGYGTCTLALSVVVGLIGLVGPSSAGAATQIGQTFAPATGCTDIQTQFPTATAGASYAAPIPGVITSWSFLAGSSPAPPQLKLKVARQVSGNDYTIVGESGLANPAPGVLNTFPTRIPVRVGDVIGFYNNTDLGGRCGELGNGINFAIRHSQIRGRPARYDRRRSGPAASGSTSRRCSSPMPTTTASATRPRTAARPTHAPRARARPTRRSPRAPGQDQEEAGDVRVQLVTDRARRSSARSTAGRSRPAPRPTAQGQEGQAPLRGPRYGNGQTDATPATDDWKVKKKKKK